MIDKKLFNLVDGTKQLILKDVFYRWLSLLVNIVFLFNIKRIFDKDVSTIASWLVAQCFLIFLKIVFGSLSKKQSVKTSNKVKESLRIKLYNFLMSLGASYQTHISSATTSQLMSEGVDQLEVYFGLYLPQFFYAVLAPLTLFVFLSFFNLKVALILLILVPLIPLSIVFVQKIAKRILNRYWGSYTELSSSFLDSLQGLSTLKFYQMDEMKHQQINQESESFRKATMRVLVMQLNSISVMDLVAYGGSMLAILMAYKEYSLNAFSLGTFLMIILISSEFFIPMRLLGSYFHIAMNGAAAAQRIFDVFEIDIDKIDEIDTLKSYNFVAKNMNYAYETKQVLFDINFN
ncbi:MAG TPA: ABC transporter transmembrane domain-containing protein, partial [Erysipelothrix sp.]|nr:ABC transporter transmembrane domain-containing protein [Erysipelothrix sp.]